ncbi:MAG: TerB family tellurite resistance protein [Rhodoferax sp.]|nr:TerB family tellurite resistance protein [Rhodoferax sp.]
MLSSIQSFLSSLFMPDGAAQPANEARALQLATAVLLVEVMRCDTDWAPEESAATKKALRNTFALGEEELASLMAQAEQTAQGANDYFHFTSAMNDQFTQDQKIQVVELMWQVAYADGRLDENEQHLISKIAGLLHVTHGEYIAAKMRAKAALS